MSQNTDQDGYHGQTAKFIATVIQCMPKLDREGMQRWIDDPIGLKRTLTNALEGSKSSTSPLLKIWKKLTIEWRRSPEQWLAMLERKGVILTEHAQRFISSWQPSGRSSRQVIASLVLISEEELGFTGVVDFRTLCARARDLGLTLLPKEAGPAMCGLISKQPSGNYYRIAMEPENFESQNVLWTICNDKYELRLISSRMDTREPLEPDASKLWVFQKK